MTIVALILLVSGLVLTLIAAIGLLRLPDPLQRMHSATKAGTLGTTLIVLGTLILVDDVRPSTAILTIVFLLFTLPIGAQLLGRASYLSGVKLKGVTEDAIPEINQANEPHGTGSDAKTRRRSITQSNLKALNADHQSGGLVSGD